MVSTVLFWIALIASILFLISGVTYTVLKYTGHEGETVTTVFGWIAVGTLAVGAVAGLVSLFF